MTFPEAFKGDYNSGTGKMIADFNNVEESVHKNYTTIKDGETSIGNCQINIYLWYDSYFGDSLTACRLSMYELDQKRKVPMNIGTKILMLTIPISTPISIMIKRQVY